MKNIQSLIEEKPDLDEIPHEQREFLKQPLSQFDEHYPRNEAMARAYLSGQHTMAAIARHFKMHYSTVSRAVKAFGKDTSSV